MKQAIEAKSRIVVDHFCTKVFKEIDTFVLDFANDPEDIRAAWSAATERAG